MIETGEIYHISENNKGRAIGHEIWGNRPGIVISSYANLQNEGTVKIVYLSSKDKSRPSSVEISKESFYNNDKRNKYTKHIALCSQIHTVDKSRLESCYGKISKEELEQIKHTVIQTIF